MPWYDGLEGAALAFARSVARKLRALAGSGTGKTFALIRRLMRVVEEERVPANEVLVLTFARTAAADISRPGHACRPIIRASRSRATTSSSRTRCSPTSNGTRAC